MLGRSLHEQGIRLREEFDQIMKVPRRVLKPDIAKKVPRTLNKGKAYSPRNSRGAASTQMEFFSGEELFARILMPHLRNKSLCVAIAQLPA